MFKDLNLVVSSLWNDNEDESDWRNLCISKDLEALFLTHSAQSSFSIYNDNGENYWIIERVIKDL